MNVGMYVRTTGDAYEPSKIGKIKEVDITSFKEVCYRIDSCGKHILIPESFIKKTSFNLIDLIEVNDIIEYYNDDRKVVLRIINEQHLRNIIKQIKEFSGILTHEQYENNCYRVERK